MDAVRGALPARVAQPDRRDRHLQRRSARSRSSAIVDIQLAELRERLADRKIELELTDAAKELLAVEGFDPVYGARPLKRAIQQEIVQPLAMQLLRGEFHDGDTIVADAAGREARVPAREEEVDARAERKQAPGRRPVAAEP